MNSQGHRIATGAGSALALLLAASVILHLIFYNGAIGSDDTAYFDFASGLVNQGSLIGRDHHAARLMLLATVGAPAAWLGSIEVAQAICLALSLSLIAAVTLFVRRELGDIAAVAALVIIGFSAVEIVHSAVFLPEPLLATLMFGSTVSLYFACEGRVKPRLALIALSGAMVGFAYSVKEPGILLTVPTIAYLLVRRDPGTLKLRAITLIIFGGAFTLVALLDAALLYVLTDDILFKQHGIQRGHNWYRDTPVFMEIAKESYWKTSNLASTHFALAVPLAVGAAGWILICLRRSSLLIFALSGAFVFIYLMYGSSSLSRYLALPYQDRYLIPLLPFAAIGGAALVATLSQLSSGRKLIPGAVALLAAIQLLSAVVLSAERSGRVFFTEAITNLDLLFENLPNDGRPIYTSQWASKNINVVAAPGQLSRIRIIEEFKGNLPSGYHLRVVRDDAAIWLVSGDREYEQATKELTLVGRSAQSTAWRFWGQQAAEVYEYAELRLKP
ncbi:MAG: glycosyltransferase family 39 protein [Pseudomonadota bacterium]